jgi:fido (protein-threonine AMPylation protein)
MQTCSACHYRRRKYLLGGDSYSCTKSGKLCSIADLRLAEIYQYEKGDDGPLSLAHHQKLMLAVQEGQQKALRLVNNDQIRFPSSASAFQRTVLLLHGQIFGGTGLRFSGTFRQPGEPDVHFGSGRNERRGVAAEVLSDRLDALYDGTLRSFQNTEVDAAGLARVCGRFLQEFFMIHPFHDGNGRVARLFIRVMANSTGRYYFDVLPEDNRSRKKYTGALAFAHRHLHSYAGQASDYSTIQDPYKHIARWLTEYIREHVFVGTNGIEEHAPEWLEEEKDLVDRPGWDDPTTLDEPYDYHDDGY